MFARFLRGGSIIDHGLKIVGSVVSEGAVEVNGHIQGDLQCAKLFISPKSCINGSIQAQQVVVNGRVEGPIKASAVVLKPHAIVVGDIQADSLTVERGAYFDGRSTRLPASNLPKSEKVSERPRKIA